MNIASLLKYTPIEILGQNPLSYLFHYYSGQFQANYRDNKHDSEKYGQIIRGKDCVPFFSLPVRSVRLSKNRIEIIKIEVCTGEKEWTNIQLSRVDINVTWCTCICLIN